MRAEFANSEEAAEYKNIADAQVIAGTLRFSDLAGNPHSVDDGRITDVRSKRSEPFKVAVKGPDGGTTTRSRVTVAGVDGGAVYLAGGGFVERYDGEIKRVRQMWLD